MFYVKGSINPNSNDAPSEADSGKEKTFDPAGFHRNYFSQHYAGGFQSPLHFKNHVCFSRLEHHPCPGSLLRINPVSPLSSPDQKTNTARHSHHGVVVLFSECSLHSHRSFSSPSATACALLV